MKDAKIKLRRESKIPLLEKEAKFVIKKEFVSSCFPHKSAVEKTKRPSLNE